MEFLPTSFRLLINFAVNFGEFDENLQFFNDFRMKK